MIATHPSCARISIYNVYISIINLLFNEICTGKYKPGGSGLETGSAEPFS